jgi:hypothetical protein
LIPWQIKPFACPFFFTQAPRTAGFSGLLATYPPKVTENQFFIFDVTTGYLPKAERNRAGECPEPNPLPIRRNLKTY